MKIEDAIQQKAFSSPTHKVIVNLLYTNIWATQQQMKVFKPYNLSLQQYNVLRILRGQLPHVASVKLIAERMIDKSSNVSRLVAKLEDKKLIDRKINKLDKRQVDVKISSTGLKLLDKLDKENEKAYKDFTELSDAELEKLSDMLDALRG